MLLRVYSHPALCSCVCAAFCCISTGVFGYPQEAAAQTALETVRAWFASAEAKDGSAATEGSEEIFHLSLQRVIFNVFTSTDEQIYHSLAPRVLSECDS